MTIASAVRAILPRLVQSCACHRFVTVGVALVLAVLSVVAAQQRLGVTTDTSLLFSNSLPWKRASDALARAFPQNDGLLVAVIDGTIPEEAEATAAALAEKLRIEPKLFRDVTQPDASAYLQANAFLLIGTKELQDLLDRTVDAQPFLGQLVADPSLRGLFSALSLVAEGASRGLDAASLGPALTQFHLSLSQAADGHAAPLSWEELLAGPLAKQAGRFRFVTVKPVLDYGALQPGGAASSAMRAAASGLPYVVAHQARVRLTGSVALDDEEFSSVAQGAAIGLGGSFLLVVVWLFAAVRSWRLTVPIALTLVLGLLLTTGFAAVAVGTLNLISVAFAILFVGIAVDFAIQFTVRFRERRHVHPGVIDALRETGRGSGSQILVASLATASGFLAFTPTKFTGVAQLGIIAGGGMLIAFLTTLTFLPALLVLFKPRREKREVGVMMLRRLEPLVRPLHWPILVLFTALALVGAALTPSIPFDGDPLHTKNQHTEAVTTLDDLMDDPVTNPYTIEALLPSLAAARVVAPKLGKLSTVQDVLSLNSFVPEDQPAKLAIIADAASILGPTLTPPATVTPPDAGALRRAAAALAGKLDAVVGRLPPADRLRAIAGDLARLAHADDATLLAAQDALLRFLPMQLARLRTALAAKPVTLARLCSLIPASLWPALVQLVGHEEPNIAYGALSVLANLSFSSAAIVDGLLGAGLLSALTSLWAALAQQPTSDANVLVHAQLSFIVSCIAASTSHAHLIQLIAHCPLLLEAMVADLSSPLLEISKEAAWSIGNLTRGYWGVQRKDLEGRYPLAGGGGGGAEERETKERRRLLASKDGLVRGLCALLSLEYEEDEEHCELIQVALVALTNLLSDEWWVYAVLDVEGAEGLRRAQELRHSSSKALRAAQTLNQSLAALQAHGLVASPPVRLDSFSTSMSDDSSLTAESEDGSLPLPPFQCFDPSNVLDAHPNAKTYCAFPTASPLHPAATHPVSATFLACRGLPLLARLERSSLPFVREYAEWVLCLFFTEFCKEHDQHTAWEYEPRPDGAVPDGLTDGRIQSADNGVVMRNRKSGDPHNNGALASGAG